MDLIKELHQMAEAAKPDYIDADGDGDKKETMKKALKDKEKKKKDDLKEGRYDMMAKAVDLKDKKKKAAKKSDKKPRKTLSDYMKDQSAGTHA